MNQSVHLVGSDDVSRAGNSIVASAHEMARAASEITYAVENLRRLKDEFMQELRDELQKLKEKTNG